MNNSISTIKLIIFGFVLHIILLLSVFEIYFQSPVIEGLTPLSDLSGAPAKRVVLFVADGLRAESFFQAECERTPYIKRIILNGGIVGLSHTRVPTESRPGHVAIIAGLYEDPSAVAKGWQENPVDFDSVFNRSRHTYSWGSPDIVPMFAKSAVKGRVYTDSYDADAEDFSGKHNTIEQDNWVFRKVEEFFARSDHESLRKNDKTVFFLHLLGLDTAGHVHKPHSAHYTENMKAVDAGIEKMVKLIEEVFGNDGKTSYIFTADHGMTDRGAHGGGEPYETETPFVAWGAGIKNAQNQDVNPKFNINQADIAPLMSTLIGVAVPVNNVGTLPHSVLNVSDEYLARALRNNAYQITKNFKYWLSNFQMAKIRILSREFDNLRYGELGDMENFIDGSIDTGYYLNAVASSKKLIDLGLEGIEYYQSYYQTPLLIAVSLAMLAWILFLFEQLLKTKEEKKWFDWNQVIFGVVLSALTLFVVYLQGISLRMGGFFILPIVSFSFLNCSTIWKVIRTKLTFQDLGYILVFIVLTELMVLSFFERSVLTLLLVLMGIFSAVKQSSSKQTKFLTFKWIFTTVLLAVFPSFPVVHKDTNNYQFLFFGVAFWLLIALHRLTRKPTFFDKLHVGIVIIFVVNFVSTLKHLNDQEGLEYFNQIISWILLVTSFLYPLTSQLTVERRITAIGSAQMIPFALMSLTYEPIFFLAIFANIFYWLQIEHANLRRKNGVCEGFPTIVFSKAVVTNRAVEWDDIRRGYFILLYILISFFGTGNMASVSSFDPNWVRCLVSTFAPFLMASLIIIKLLMPIFLVICAMKAIHVITEIRREKLFIILLIISDMMCANFLFLVRNKGSWLEIGTSISHFVIMDVTVLVLFILFAAATVLTTVKINACDKSSEDSILPKTREYLKTR